MNSIDHFLSMSVWYNSLIRIDKRPVFFKSWYLKGIEQITHLMKDRDTFLSFQTNDFLKKIGIKEDNMCTFCKIEVESLVHLFWFCEATCWFWRGFKQWLTTEKGMTDLGAINLTPAIIIGLKPHSFRDKQVHLFFLIARYFIWFSKMQDKAPDIQFFSLSLKPPSCDVVSNCLVCLASHDFKFEYLSHASLSHALFFSYFLK